MADEQTEIIEEVEQEEQTQPKPDKPVEQSRFNQYREAFLRERLRDMQVQDSSEMDAALTFIDDRTDATDSNLDEVFMQLKVRMRLGERQKYVDPNPMNGFRTKPRPIDGQELGKRVYERLKKKGRI